MLNDYATFHVMPNLEYDDYKQILGIFCDEMPFRKIDISISKKTKNLAPNFSLSHMLQSLTYIELALTTPPYVEKATIIIQYVDYHSYTIVVVV